MNLLSSVRLTKDVLQVRKTGRADDGRRDMRLREDPRDSNLRHADAFLLRELFHSVNPDAPQQHARTNV